MLNSSSQPEEVLSGPWLYKKFDLAVVKSFLAGLTPKELTTTIVRKFTPEELKSCPKEKWYGTEYISAGQMDAARIAKLEAIIASAGSAPAAAAAASGKKDEAEEAKTATLTAEAALFLPPRNDFIAEDFSIRRSEDDLLQSEKNESKSSSAGAAAAAAAAAGASATAAAGVLLQKSAAAADDHGGLVEFKDVPTSEKIRLSKVPPQMILVADEDDNAAAAGSAVVKSGTNSASAKIGPVELWYKLDRVFQRPKMNVIVSINTPLAYASPEGSVLTNLYAKLVEVT